MLELDIAQKAKSRIEVLGIGHMVGWVLVLAGVAGLCIALFISSSVFLLSESIIQSLDGLFKWFCIGWMIVCIPDVNTPHSKVSSAAHHMAETGSLEQWNCIRILKLKSLKSCLDTSPNGGTRAPSAYRFKVLDRSSWILLQPRANDGTTILHSAKQLLVLCEWCPCTSTI